MSYDYADRPKLLLSGLDSLYVSYYLDTAALPWEELAYRKEKLQRTRSDDFTEIELGGEAFAVLPHGAHPYPYVLRNDWAELRIAETLQPSCHIRFPSKALWELGVEALLQRARDWMAATDLPAFKDNAVARADWAFDYDLPTIDFLPEHFLSRARKDATHRDHGKLQTVVFGRGDIVIRVYDKVAEIGDQSGKAWFFDLWGQRDNVWRVECQVRRERLKEAGIRTTEELMDLQNDLLRELATRHTTLRRPSSDSNRARWPLHPLWRALREDIAKLPQTGLVRHIDPRNPLDWRLYQQAKAMYGNLKGLTAALMLLRDQTDPTMPLDTVLGELPALLRTHHDDALWASEIGDRIRRYDLGLW